MTKKQFKKAIQDWVNENYGDDDSWDIDSLAQHLEKTFKEKVKK